MEPDVDLQPAGTLSFLRRLIHTPLGDLLRLRVTGRYDVKAVLAPDSGLSFPQSYGVLFAVALLLLTLQVGSFSLIIEPAEAVEQRPAGLLGQLRRASRLPLRDRNYGRYLILRVAIVISTYASPFYAVYARRSLGAPEDMVGIYVLALTLASVLANLALGRISDRLGNRLLVRLASGTAMLPALAALLIARTPGIGIDTTVAFGIVFLLQGLHVTASVLGNSNYLLELSSSIERVLYIGLAHGIVGLAWFTLPIGGAIVDAYGFDLLFGISVGAGLVATLLSLTLEEPRKRRPATAVIGVDDRG